MHSDLPMDVLFEAIGRGVPSAHPTGEDAQAYLQRELIATGGPSIRGDVHGPRWAVVAHARERTLIECAEVQALVALRGGTLATLLEGQSLLAWWRATLPRPRAVTVLGEAIPWSDVEALQRSGPVVGRLPFADARRIAAWAVRTLARWNPEDDPAMPRRAWIVAPTDDDFTRELARCTLGELEGVLAGLGFTVPPSARSEPHEPVSMVVLLTHGRETPVGDPVIPEVYRDRVLHAAETGALIVHLGCHGAGRSKGTRYGDAVRLVGVQPFAPAERDVHAPFALDCLARGATAVLAHLDGTWSRTFESPDALIQTIEWLADGACTAGYAAACLANEANRHAAEAMRYKIAGAFRDAGEAWIRYLDLSGFVCLGEACAWMRWRD